MKQLTLRGFDEELEGRLEKLARERSISLNRAALLLMRRGAGLATLSDHSGDQSAGAPTIGSALDRFVGVWSEDEEREFLCSIDDLDRVDSELWE
jgi:hypothetical protein